MSYYTDEYYQETDNNEEGLDSPTFISENDDGSYDVVEVEEEGDAVDGAILEDELNLNDDPDAIYDSLHGVNLCEGYLSEDKIRCVADNVFQGVREDVESNHDAFDTLKQGMDLLGIKLEESGTLGPWSCGASHPLIIESAVKLQSMAETELDPPDGPCRTRIFGNNMNPEVEGIAARKENFINYLLTENSDGYFSESSKVFLSSALMGVAYKGLFWDPVKQGIDARFLRPDQFIINSEARDISTASRYTVVLPSSDIEISERQRMGLYRKVSLTGNGYNDDDEGEAYSASANMNKAYIDDKDINIESHVEINEATLNYQLKETIDDIIGVDYKCERLLLHSYVLLDAADMLSLFPDELEEEIEENNEERESRYLPFVVTTELYSGKVLSIYANWERGDKSFTPIQYYVDYQLIPGFGFMSFGFIHLLGNHQKMLTSIMRNLVDSGMFANLQGGFKMKGTKLSGTNTIAPGEFVDVETMAQDINKAIMTLPFKEPSQVLAGMYQQLESRGQMFANATEGVVEDSTNYGKVGTTLALLDASSKLTTSIIRRFHRARRRELGIVERLVKENVEAYPYAIDGIEDLAQAFQQDFNNDLIKVVPVSDPNVPNRADRLALAQNRIQIAQQFPQVHDVRAALWNVYKTLGDENPDKLLPPPQGAKPQDPMSDIVSAVNGHPISAFKGQNHDAYIQVFNSWATHPETQQNPTFGPAINAVTAVARQHAIMKFQEQIEGLTVTGAATDPNTIAQLQAEAAVQLQQQATQLAQLAANAEDPTTLMARVQDKKADIDAMKTESKEKVEFARLSLDKARLDLEKQKLDMDHVMSDNKIQADLIKHDDKLKLDALKEQSNIVEKRTARALDLLGEAAEYEKKQREVTAKGDK